MEIIKSINNSYVQELKRIIAERGYRSKIGAFLIEGQRIVSDCPTSRIIRYYVGESLVGKFSAIIGNKPCCVFEDKLLERVLDTKSPQGIAAVCSMNAGRRENNCHDSANTSITQSDGLIASVGRANMAFEPGKLTVIADNIADPANMATIIRSMAACGAVNLALVGDCCDVYSPKVARASMGGIFYINIVEMAAEDIRCDSLLVLDMNGEDIYHLNDVYVGNNDSVGLVVGSEARGISSEIASLPHRVVSLPMCGNMESLNAGVSLSIAIYELVFGKARN